MNNLTLFVYLGYDNESSHWVHFDELKIAHTESPVLQVNACYPFGLLACTWLRDGEKENLYGYQGKEYDSLTRWHDFHARQYDAALGRWFVADPAGQFASPYGAMGNNPVMMIDPDGRFAFVPFLVAAAVGGIVNLGIEAIEGDIHNFRDGLRAFGIGALKGGLSYLTGPAGSAATLGKVGLNSAMNVASSQINPVMIPIGNRASIGFSPFFGWGSNGLTVSANFYGSLAIDDHFSIGGGISLRGTENIFNYGGSWHNGDWSISYSRNTFVSAEIPKQTTGAVSVRHKQWSFNIENDWPIGDGADRYRTAAGSVGYRYGDIDLALGFALWTGDPGKKYRTYDSYLTPRGKIKTYYTSGDSDAIRHGFLFAHFGYKGVAYRAGIDSEGVRAAIQNGFHDFLTTLGSLTPHFRRLTYLNGKPLRTTPYYYYGLFLPFTHY